MTTLVHLELTLTHDEAIALERLLSSAFEPNTLSARETEALDTLTTALDTAIRTTL